jgi:PST family polysaccharide transporter
VLFSALSRLQHDRPAMIAKYLSTVRVVVTITAAVGFGMAVMAHEIVAVLYGADFAKAADVLAVLALFAFLYSVNFHSGDVYKATGRPGLLAALNLVKLVVLVPAVWWAAGISALSVAVALVLVELVLGTIRLLVVTRVLGVSLRRQLAEFVRPVAAASAAAVLLWALAQIVPAWPPAVRLLVLVPVALGIYGVALRVVAPQIFTSAVELVRTRRLVEEGTPAR